MGKIKAVFFDIDGTLVSFKTHRIPQSTLDAVAALRSRGIKVYIATGRPVPFIDNLGELEYDGMITIVLRAAVRLFFTGRFLRGVWSVSWST